MTTEITTDQQRIAELFGTVEVLETLLIGVLKRDGSLDDGGLKSQLSTIIEQSKVTPENAWAEHHAMGARATATRISAWCSINKVITSAIERAEVPQPDAVDWAGLEEQIDQFERDINPGDESCWRVIIPLVRGMISDAQTHGLRELSEDDVAERSQPLWRGQKPRNDVLIAMLRCLPIIQTVHERRLRLRLEADGAEWASLAKSALPLVDTE